MILNQINMAIIIFSFWFSEIVNGWWNNHAIHTLFPKKILQNKAVIQVSYIHHVMFPRTPWIIHGKHRRTELFNDSDIYTVTILYWTIHVNFSYKPKFTQQNNKAALLSLDFKL